MDKRVKRNFMLMDALISVIRRVIVAKRRGKSKARVMYSAIYKPLFA